MGVESKQVEKVAYFLPEAAPHLGPCAAGTRPPTGQLDACDWHRPALNAGIVRVSKVVMVQLLTVKSCFHLSEAGGPPPLPPRDLGVTSAQARWIPGLDPCSACPCSELTHVFFKTGRGKPFLKGRQSSICIHVASPELLIASTGLPFRLSAATLPV